MQEISSVTIQSVPTATAPTTAPTPAAITNNFSQLLEAILGIGEPDATVLLIATAPAADAEKSDSAEESLAREISELVQQAASPLQSAVDSIASPKKACSTGKTTGSQASNDSDSAPLVATVDSAGQLLPSPVSTIDIGTPQHERLEPSMPAMELRALTSVPSLQ